MRAPCRAFFMGLLLSATSGCADMRGMTAPKAALADPLEQARLDQANQACKARDFAGFFEVLAMSPRLRRMFTAPRVRVTAKGRTRRVARARYDGFPVEALDWDYIVAGSFVPGVEQDYVELRIDQGSGNAVRVDWVRARYDGDHDGGDSLGNLLERIGPPGRLIFELAGTGCWYLTQDIRDPDDTPFTIGPQR